MMNKILITGALGKGVCKRFSKYNILNPTRQWLYNKMKSLFKYVYIPKTQPNHGEFPTNWSVPSHSELNRTIMFGSRFSIENELLVEELLVRQERFRG